jgi:hypothetical protein
MALFRTRTQTVIAVQWNGVNDEEVREALPDGVPFPPLGHWVVQRGSTVEVESPADFANRYEPLL